MNMLVFYEHVITNKCHEHHKKNKDVSKIVKIISLLITQQRIKHLGHYQETYMSVQSMHM